jgi:hypothetical protein
MLSFDYNDYEEDYKILNYDYNFMLKYNSYEEIKNEKIKSMFGFIDHFKLFELILNCGKIIETCEKNISNCKNVEIISKYNDLSSKVKILQHQYQSLIKH